MFQHIFSEDVFIISKGNQFKGTHYPLRCHLTAFIYKWIGVGFELNYNTFSLILEDILTLPRDLSSFLIPEDVLTLPRDLFSHPCFSAPRDTEATAGGRVTNGRALFSTVSLLCQHRRLSRHWN